MTTLGGTALTLLDIAKAMDPDGKMATIVEILNQVNEVVQDMTFIECNDGDSHQTTIRTGLPSGAWRRYNEGVAPTKGTTAQVRAQCGMLEANSIIDRDLANKGGNAKAVRASEAVSHIEGMTQQMATALFYEDERTNPTRFTGLAAHYSSILTTTAASAANVIDGGGTGSDNLSIWFVTWGPNATTGLVPQGSQAGLKHEDRGEVEVIDATGITGATYIALKDWFQWKMGLCVRDWRQNARVCNVDVSNLRAQSGDADLIRLMIQAEETLAYGNAGTRAIYCNRTVRSWLRQQALDKAAYQVTFETVAGKPVTMWNGIPIRVSDSLLLTESALT
jgi:hypothetical protein